ncbi:MAG: HEAT repeat domain-containing protein [Gemmataceae bacterium]
MTRTFAAALALAFAARLAADDKTAKAPPAKQPPIAEIVKQLEDKDAKVRRQAAHDLGRRNDAAAVAPLVAVLKKDKDAGVRWTAAESLGALKKLAKAAVPDLLAALKDADPMVRETAAESLADINLEPAKVVPALVELLGDADMNVRCAAAASLGDYKVAAQSAIPALEKVRKNDKHLFVREAADEAIQAINKAASKVGS